VLEIKPDYAEAHLNRGNALSELRRFEEAVPSYQRALRFNPDHGDALNNLGLAFRELDRRNDAIACWDRLLWLDPSRADAQASRAATLDMLKR
jgi:tetratricopeptide (TPR) repeat protein